MKDLATSAKNTWCIGCGNFAIQSALKAVLTELAGEGLLLEDVVLVSGIGCHAKIADYFNLNSFYSLHGRTVPSATGIKIARPRLKVICHAGDGDAYGEGMEHLIFAAKRNIDITLIVHNNRVYGLTTGQYTPTSPEGYKGRSTPFGTKELPINPLDIALSSGATFVSRGTSHGLPLLKKVIKEAILHKGFSLVDILQVCVTYYNMYDFYDKWSYEMSGHDVSDYDKAYNKAREWNYNKESKIPLGIFYKKDAPTFESEFNFSQGRDLKREDVVKKLLGDL